MHEFVYKFVTNAAIVLGLSWAAFGVWLCWMGLREPADPKWQNMLADDWGEAAWYIFVVTVIVLFFIVPGVYAVKIGFKHR